jgi:hypothetical protein
MAAPIVSENSIGIRLSWRSFQAANQTLGILKHLSISRAASASARERGRSQPFS